MLLAAACAAARPSRRPEPPRPILVAAALPAPAPDVGLYSAQEALRDVLSGGELEYIGTGRWPGVERLRACAFRNQRVLIVNAYCTLIETQAFHLDVYSPARGRVRIYAETRGVVSARQRGDYFTFMVESSPPPAATAHIPALSLAMPYEALRSYEQQRYAAYLPGCYGGVQHERPIGGCLGPLGPIHGEWAAQNQAFLEHANPDWYQVIRQLRALATRFGVDPQN